LQRPVDPKGQLLKQLPVEIHPLIEEFISKAPKAIAKPEMRQAAPVASGVAGQGHESSPVFAADAPGAKWILWRS
jgi:hypothetical protein